MANTVSGTFTSVWDDGYIVTTPCTVDMDTKEVFPEPYDGDDLDALDVLTEEHIEINGEVHPVYQKADVDPAEDVFWYD